MSKMSRENFFFFFFWGGGGFINEGGLVALSRDARMKSFGTDLNRTT